MVKLTLDSILSGFGALSKQNSNFTRISNAVENTLSRDGTSPNSMGAALDMGSNRIINVPTPTDNTDAVNKEYVDSLAVGSGNTVNITTAVDDSISNGVVNRAPSQNAVYDALALKSDKNLSNVLNADFAAKMAAVGGGTSAGIDDAISNGVTARAPSQNAVYDALALKAALVHTHAQSDVTGLTAALTAKADKDLTNVLDADFLAKASSAGVGIQSDVLKFVDYYFVGGDPDDTASITRSLAANNYALLDARTYTISNEIVLTNKQSIIGMGPDTSALKSTQNNKPCIKISGNVYNFRVANLTTYHSVVAIAGGDGIQQVQGAAHWVDNGVIENVFSRQNYIGFNLGIAFSAFLSNCVGIGNVNDGFRFTSGGTATLPGPVTTTGQLQWVLNNCGGSSNGHDGFGYYSGGAVAPGLSVGTLNNPTTFANVHHGIAAYGSAATPLQAVRIKGGFIGEDLGNGVYLDTYGINHIVSPNYMELAGISNIRLTANNNYVTVQVGHCSGAGDSGILSDSPNLNVNGGCYFNNGVTAVGAGVGIHINAGSAAITGILAGNTGASTYQDYGVTTAVDGIMITGCRLDTHVIAPIFFAVTPTSSVVSGCFPYSANFINSGSSTTITGDLTVTGTITSNTDLVSTGTLHVTGASAFVGGVNITGASGLAVTNGVTCKDLAVTRSAGIGAIGASGTTGKLNVDTITIATSATVPTLTTSTDLVANGQFHGNGASAFTNSLNVTGSVAVSAGVTAQDLQATRSLGVQTAASGIAGQIDAPTHKGANLTITGTVTAPTGTFSTAVTAPTITSAADLIANGFFHSNAAAAFTAGGVTVVAGGLAVTGGVNADNMQVPITGDIFKNGVAYVNP